MPLWQQISVVQKNAFLLHCFHMVQLAINMEAKSVARTLKEKGLASYGTLLFMSKKLRIISTLLVICKMSERTRFLHFLTLEAAYSSHYTQPDGLTD